jgi:hypothetical protein
VLQADWMEDWEEGKWPITEGGGVTWVWMYGWRRTSCQAWEDRAKRRNATPAGADISPNRRPSNRRARAREPGPRGLPAPHGTSCAISPGASAAGEWSGEAAAVGLLPLSFSRKGAMYVCVCLSHPQSPPRERCLGMAAFQQQPHTPAKACARRVTRCMTRAGSACATGEPPDSSRARGGAGTTPRAQQRQATTPLGR